MLILISFQAFPGVSSCFSGSASTIPDPKEPQLFYKPAVVQKAKVSGFQIWVLLTRTFNLGLQSIKLLLSQTEISERQKTPLSIHHGRNISHEFHPHAFFFLLMYNILLWGKAPFCAVDFQTVTFSNRSVTTRKVRSCCAVELWSSRPHSTFSSFLYLSLSLSLIFPVCLFVSFFFLCGCHFSL